MVLVFEVTSRVWGLVLLLVCMEFINACTPCFQGEERPRRTLPAHTTPVSSSFSLYAHRHSKYLPRLCILFSWWDVLAVMHLTQDPTNSLHTQVSCCFVCSVSHVHVIMKASVLLLY